jgi:hypothetical protein
LAVAGGWLAAAGFGFLGERFLAIIALGSEWFEFHLR